MYLRRFGVACVLNTVVGVGVVSVVGIVVTVIIARVFIAIPSLRKPSSMVIHLIICFFIRSIVAAAVAIGIVIHGGGGAG